MGVDGEILNRKFMPIDYEIDLLKKLQGLKKVRRSVQEYKEEECQVINIIIYFEVNKENVVYYINGLRSSIQ